MRQIGQPNHFVAPAHDLEIGAGRRKHHVPQRFYIFGQEITDASGWRDLVEEQVEIGATQADAVSRILRRHELETVCIHKDLSGLPRVIEAAKEF